MKIKRVWAMPNKWTFQITPIQTLLKKYVGGGKGWVDPMSGMYSPAELTNDINSETPAKNHGDALKFLVQLPSNRFEGVLFDPPYSLEQAKRKYKQNYFDTQTFFDYIQLCKKEIRRIVKIGGYVIIFGWDSNGIGKKYGFHLNEVLLVPHGGYCRDTIITVEQKAQTKLCR